MAGSVLLVDDEANILNALSRELHSWSAEKAIRIETAESAQEALDRLGERSGEVAVIVSDLKMPGMLGSDFLLEVRERWPDITTILLTGFSETEQVMKAVKAGIFSYITKPWDPDYLRSELETAFEIHDIRVQNRLYRTTLEEELRWAGEMQRALLRPRAEGIEGMEFQSSYEPMPGLYCGGDYYDLVAFGPGRYISLLGDVAGHGLRAALVTGILRAIIYPEYIRTIGQRRFSPSAFLGWLNDRMSFELSKTSGLVITFFAGLVDIKEGTFTYANAGQNRPFIIREGKARELTLSGPGLGFAESVAYEEESLRIGSGDILALYTDGLVEAGARDDATPPVDLAGIIERTPWGPDWNKRVMDAALEATGMKHFEDDVTLMAARIS
jgi:sigma-B regulation protein RsbU (phosphoserine phosphatase)